MSKGTLKSVETFLERYDESDWNRALDSLAPSMHEVDRNAVRIWFRFYPLSLHRYLTSADNESNPERGIALQGTPGLQDRINTSHSFLYGSRYWSDAAAVIIQNGAELAGSSTDLVGLIGEVARATASRAKTDVSLVTAIVAVALMTLVQVGADKFESTTFESPKPKGILSKSPDAVVSARKQDDSQGLLGFLKTVDKKYSVIFDERNGARFEVLSDQEIASASGNDRSQDWQAKDPRCWEGPVPVECTSASCGTCWVGVIAGSSKLSEPGRRERRAIKVFGYDQTNEADPLIRLACQARAYGNVTIVIPPWNAVFGKKVYGNVEELELEPVTTSAKTLREIVRETTAGGSDT